MGGAGVARFSDAQASYWNPANLGFYKKPFSARFDAGAGIAINSALADNTDKLGKLDFKALNDLNTTGKTTAAALKSAGEAVQLIGILKDIDNKGGALTVTPVGALAFQYRQFGLGAFVTSEMAVYVNTVDTINVMPANANTSLNTFASNIGATAGRPATPLFSATQYTSLVTSFGGNATIVDTLERQLATSNPTGLSADQLAQSLTDLSKSFATPTAIIDNNKTSLALRGIVLSEVPIAYGHQLDLKEFGQLGIGAAAKIMMGTTYGSVVSLVNSKGSNNLVKKITDSKTDSVNVGLDLGLAWRKQMPAVGLVSTGVVAKNLNAPEFDNPKGFGGKTKVEPQIRLGAAIDPFEWLTVAADMDMTENKTVAKNGKSQNFGMGAELKPLGWVAVRGGLYTNIADSSSGPVGTFGISLGPQWLRFDVDGAVAFKTATFDNKSYPREGKVEFGLSTMF